MSRYSNIYLCEKEDLVNNNLPPGIVCEVKERTSPYSERCIYIPITLKKQLFRERIYETYLRTIVSDDGFYLNPSAWRPLSKLHPKVSGKDYGNKWHRVTNKMPQLYFNQKIIEPNKSFSRLYPSNDYFRNDDEWYLTLRRLFHARVEALMINISSVLCDKRIPVDFVIGTVPDDSIHPKSFEIYMFTKTDGKIQEFDEGYGIKMSLVTGRKYVKVEKLGYGIWQEKDEELLFITNKESIKLTAKSKRHRALTHNQVVTLNDVLLAG